MKKFSSILIVLLLMLASFTAGLEYPRGDVNQDNMVDIDDVTCLISYILNGTWPDEGPASETFTVNGVSFTMIPVEGGTFTMGLTEGQVSDGQGNNVTPHEVTLSSYYIAETEVTQELWLAVMGTNPADFSDNLQNPVQKVTWGECQTFISMLNEKTGKTFRLPTEAEWEFAARGGNMSQGYQYSGSNDLDEVGWYDHNSGGSPHPVGTKAPNELGLYDMSGNVYEWCQDYYSSTIYNVSPAVNPVETEWSNWRVMRGGGWVYFASLCQVSSRGMCMPNERFNDIGLRLAL